MEGEGLCSRRLRSLEGGDNKPGKVERGRVGAGREAREETREEEERGGEQEGLMGREEGPEEDESRRQTSQELRSDSRGCPDRD